MPIRPCYYFVQEDGTFYRVAKRTFYRILEQRDDAVHPEYKGQRVKYAEIYVHFDGRRPIAVRRAVFGYLRFDENGWFDSSEWQTIEQMIVYTWPTIEEMSNPEITEQQMERAEAHIQRQFGWVPTPELRQRLYEAALHHKLSGGQSH